MVEILNSTLSIPVQIFLKNPPEWTSHSRSAKLEFEHTI